jgi:hypothetical protein
MSGSREENYDKLVKDNSEWKKPSKPWEYHQVLVALKAQISTLPADAVKNKSNTSNNGKQQTCPKCNAWKYDESLGIKGEYIKAVN